MKALLEMKALTFSRDIQILTSLNYNDVSLKNHFSAARIFLVLLKTPKKIL